MFNEHNEMMHQPPPKLQEVAISFVDNGFVIRVNGTSFNKHYVVQAESNRAEEIEAALDVIRSVYHQIHKAPGEAFDILGLSERNTDA